MPGTNVTRTVIDGFCMYDINRDLITAPKECIRSAESRESMAMRPVIRTTAVGGSCPRRPNDLVIETCT